ncbi:MAG: EAL domain-containing protein, partial [Kangiellaceae bacterium]|nr:EAL domain-containing protein [Kangiellaceae bacterium]
NRFFPSVNKEKLYVKAPSLVNLNIANRAVEVGADRVLARSLITTKKIKLLFDQTPFSFDFTSPQFVSPEELKFRYRLLGLSEKWIISDASEREATYTNIGAGDYIFELQVGTSQGSWNEDIRRLNIQILPPWWKTNLAYSIYSLVFSIFVGAFVFYWNKKRKSERLIQIAIQENEERLKLSLWGSGYEFWDWNLSSGQVSRSNQFNKIQIECNYMGMKLNELAGYIHPEDLMMVKEKLTNHIAGNSKHFDVCYRIVDSKRGWRWIQDRGKVVAYDQSGIPLRMSGTQRDITDIREKEAQFEMLGQAFKSTSDGVWIRDHEWRLVECNPAYERITGFSLSEKKGEVLWFPEIQEQPENLLQRIRISIDEKGSWQGEAWAERKNNDPFPQKLSIDTLHDEKGNIRYYVGVFSDITFHKRTEEEFRKLANYDSLTGLPNRACLYDRLNQTIEKTKRDQGRFALFLIDVDNFKRINDSLGHSVGDILIRQVASRLVNCNKEGDTVARIGGDEFIIVMEKVRSSTSVAAFAELLLHELNQPIFVKGEQLKLNFSVGVTLAPDDAIIAERLMRNADTAMYEAKKSIDNSYRFFSVEFNERARKRLELENALRKAIDDDAIDLHYQPKVDLTTGRVKGVEALARWTHREIGFVSPDEFIPLAEETGLILPLGEKILLKAIKQTKEWVDKGVMRGRTSVNLSAHQFWNKNLAGQILNLLDDFDLDAKYIELEITESACMQDTEETKNQIEQLKNIGISLALDDFGTGYSSLAQLKSLPFDTLKVDKSFVDNIETNRQDEKVVKAIIDIAKTMEMEVVIEGVESKSQCKYLWKNRAYVVQGYFFSKPVKSDQIERLFEVVWHKKDYLGKFISNVTPLV